MKKKLLLTFLFVFLMNFIILNYSFANTPTIYAGSAILIDSNTGEVLYEKNSNNLMYPASTTKVLTAIISIESCTLDEKVTAGETAITSIKSGYTNANIQVGEQLTMEELLYALLLNSANEAANVIAEHIGGTIENFANIMNAKAIELGCTSTHFVNANGIHSDSHYTTASDLAKITRYCMQNETFRKMVSTKTYPLPATAQYPQADRILKNSNSLMNEDHQFYYPYAIGVKTGFTSQAKNCLISASYKDGLELISVVLHAETTEDGCSARYLDTISLLEYGNNNYKSYPLLAKGDIVDTLEVSNATQNTKNVNIIAKNNLSATLKIDEQAEISSSEISINTGITAPIEVGTVLGKANYVVNGKNYTVDLVAESNVELFASKKPPETSTINFKSFFHILFVLIILWLIFQFLKRRIIIFKAQKLRKRARKYLNP